MMYMINNILWYILPDRKNRGYFEWKNIIALDKDNKIFQKWLNAEEISIILNVLAKY